MKKCLMLLGLSFSLTFSGIILTSCNVTRKITTESSYIQKGDTTTTIVTKTTETYDAKKQ